MSKLEMIFGSCANQTADVVVNAANRYLSKGGGICGVIFSKAGSSELTEACRKHKTPLKDGEVVITPSFNLSNAKAIIHAVGPDFRITPRAFKELYNAYYNSLIAMKDNSYHSISFPLISSGIFSGGKEGMKRESASQCRRAYMKFTSDNPDYDVHVMLCAYEQGEYDEAKAELDLLDSIKPEDMDRWNDGGEGIVAPHSKSNTSK